MSLKGAGYIVGAYEHPTRKATDKSVALLHAECAKGALEDAGLSKDDIDGYFCAGDAPGMGPISMVDYMNLKCRHVDSTDVGGSSYQVAVGHALESIAAGRCSIALITLAGRPRSEGMATGTRRAPAIRHSPTCNSNFPTARPPRTCTRCARRATCTNTAPPASNSPGSRSPRRIMRSTIRMPCCATWSRSRTW